VASVACVASVVSRVLPRSPASPPVPWSAVTGSDRQWPAAAGCGRVRRARGHRLVSAARLHRPDDVDGRSRGRARTLVGSRPGAPVPPCGV